MSLNLRQQVAARQQMQRRSVILPPSFEPGINSYPHLNVLDVRFGARRLEDNPGVDPATIDNSDSFQNALDEAFLRGGGKVVVPAGTYPLLGFIIIPPYVTLEGEWESAPYGFDAWGFGDKLPNIPFHGGTTLYSYYGKGNENAPPFISLYGKSSVVKGIQIFYPEQGQGVQLFPFPWTIAGSYNYKEGSKRLFLAPWSVDPKYRERIKSYSNKGFPPSGTCAVIDVNIMNAWNGIYFVDAIAPQFKLSGIWGQPLNQGIVIDGAHDTGILEDVHFWPFWAWPDKDPNVWEHLVLQQLVTKAVAITFRWCDFMFGSNIFCFGYHVGMRFEHGRIPDTTFLGTSGLFTNVAFDAGDVGLELLHTSPNGGTFTNFGFSAWDLPPYRNSIAVKTDPNLQGDLKIERGVFAGSILRSAIEWNGAGLLQVTGSNFMEWNHPSEEQNKRGIYPGKNIPAIHIKGGRAMLQNNFFKDKNQKEGREVAVQIESNAERTMATGNALTGNTIKLYPYSDIYGRVHPEMRFVEGNMP